MSKPSFRILISREDEKETNPYIQHVGFRASYPRDAGKTALEMLRSRINKSGQKTNNLKKGTVGFLVEGERVETDGTVTKKKDVAPAK